MEAMADEDNTLEHSNTNNNNRPNHGKRTILYHQIQADKLSHQCDMVIVFITTSSKNKLYQGRMCE